MLTTATTTTPTFGTAAGSFHDGARQGTQSTHSIGSGGGGGSSSSRSSISRSSSMRSHAAAAAAAASSSPSPSSPGSQSLRSQSKLREILRDHSLRDRDEPEQQQQSPFAESSTSHTGAPSLTSLPTVVGARPQMNCLSPSSNFNTDNVYPALAAEEETRAQTPVPGTSQRAPYRAAPITSTGPPGHASSSSLEGRTEAFPFSSQMLSRDEPANVYGQQQLHSLSHAQQQTAQAGARPVAPPLYSSKSTPLLDRNRTASDAPASPHSPQVAAMQRQRSHREAVEQQQRQYSSELPQPQPQTPLQQHGAGSAAHFIPSVMLPADPPAEDFRSSNMQRARSIGGHLSSGVDLKVVILGAQGVGKTSLVHRYTSGLFSTSSVPSTIGASFLTKKLFVDGVKVRLQLWDTAGQERFRSMAPMYYRGSNAAVIVYDITNPASFDDVKSWIDELRENVHSDLVIHVVGSKLDLAPYDRQVHLDDARDAVAAWTRSDPPSPEMRDSPTQAQSSAFGSRRGLSASPPAAGRGSAAAHTQHSSPPTTLSASRLLGLGAFASLGGKATKDDAAAAATTNFEGADRLSDPSTAASTIPDRQGHAAGPSDTSFTQDWDFIDVTEVSAKDNEGIEDVFSGITARLVERREQLEAQAEARKRQQRQSIFLGDDDHSNDVAGERRGNGSAQSSWCCST